jgi:SAM-dependent methyltransferase
MDSPGVPASDAIAWERISCPLCHSTREEELLTVAPEPEAHVYRLVRCGNCGLGYQNPRPTPASIARFYPREYECYQAPVPRPAGKWDNLRLHLERLVLSQYYGHPPRVSSRLHRFMAAVARPWVQPNYVALTAIPYVGTGRLLDFGCGSGWYAHRMRERGWTVSGMDFSEHAAHQSSRRFGIPVLVGTLPHPGVKPSSVDVITMGQVLEHIYHPQSVIEAAAQALRPGGLLVASVPNLDSWGFRFFGPDWWPLDLPRHLLHFTPETLRTLLESNGFDVIDLRLLGRTSWMCRSFKFVCTRRKGWRTRAIPAIFHRSRLLTSLLTRWTVWTERADCIFVMARRKSQIPVANAA